MRLNFRPKYILEKIKNRWRNLFLFILLSIIVFITQYNLLQSPAQIGMTQDDLELLFDYKTSPDSLSGLETIWAQRGPYTTSPFFYIGILEKVFGYNITVFQGINILLKILTTLLVFPLILLVFKNRLLAFLTTFLFAVSFGSTGSLQYVVKGTEYLATSSMIIFLICYYYTFKNEGVNNKERNKYIFLSSLILYIAFLFSPIRVYPLILMLPILEIIIVYTNRNKYKIINSLIKLIVIYLPIYSLSRSGFSPASSFFLESPKVLFREVITGNWQVFLTPFSGLGYTFLTKEYISLFGNIEVDNLLSYLNFLSTGPVIIYSILTFFIAFTLSRNPKRFSIFVLFVNLIIWIVFFYVFHYSQELINYRGLKFEEDVFYTFSMGFYVISIAISSFFESIGIKQKGLLLYLTIAVLFACIFIWLTWFILGPNLTFHYPIHWYLVAPSICSSFFIAVLLVGVYNKAKQVRLKYLKCLYILLIIVILFLVNYFSKREIESHYKYLLSIGAGGVDQLMMQNKVLNVLEKEGKLQSSEPILFYLDTSEDPLNQKFYEVTLFLTQSGDNAFNFDRWMHLRKSLVMKGCIGIVSDKTKLIKSINSTGEEKGFNLEGICIEGRYAVAKKLFFKQENFYAFTLKDKNLIDIKPHILD